MPFITKSELDLKINLETNQYDSPKNCYLKNEFKISERLSRYHLQSSLIQNVSTLLTICTVDHEKCLQESTIVVSSWKY